MARPVSLNRKLYTIKKPKKYPKFLHSFLRVLINLKLVSSYFVSRFVYHSSRVNGSSFEGVSLIFLASDAFEKDYDGFSYILFTIYNFYASPF